MNIPYYVEEEKIINNNPYITEIKLPKKRNKHQFFLCDCCKKDTSFWMFNSYLSKRKNILSLCFNCFLMKRLGIKSKNKFHNWLDTLPHFTFHIPHKNRHFKLRTWIEHLEECYYLPKKG